MSYSLSALFLLPVGFIPFGILIPIWLSFSTTAALFSLVPWISFSSWSFYYLSYRSPTLGIKTLICLLCQYTHSTTFRGCSISKDSLLTMRSQLELASKEIIMNIHICIRSGLLSSFLSLFLSAWMLLSSLILSLRISFIISHSHMDSPLQTTLLLDVKTDIGLLVSILTS